MSATHSAVQRPMVAMESKKELAFLFVLVGTGAIAARLRHVIAPFLIELG